MDINSHNEFWEFVDDIDWKSRPNDAEIKKTKNKYTKEQLKRFEEHFDFFGKIVYDTIFSDEGIDIYFGGYDDFCCIDLPAEVVGRGESFFFEHARSVSKLCKFGNEGDVEESFSYIFFDSDSDSEDDSIIMNS